MYHQIIANRFFWRTTQQQEIDYIEERNGIISAYEFKWKETGRIRTPDNFYKMYHTTVTGITRENFRQFVNPVSMGSAGF